MPRDSVSLRLQRASSLAISGVVVAGCRKLFPASAGQCKSGIVASVQALPPTRSLSHTPALPAPAQTGHNRSPNNSVSRLTHQGKSYGSFASAPYARVIIAVVPSPGFELGTYRLQGGCSTN